MSLRQLKNIIDNPVSLYNLNISNNIYEKFFQKVPIFDPHNGEALCAQLSFSQFLPIEIFEVERHKWYYKKALRRK